MKKQVIIGAVVAVVVFAIGAGAYFIAKSDTPTPPEALNTTTEQPETPDNQTSEGTDNSSSRPEEEPIVVYIPDESAESLQPVGTQTTDSSDQGLVDKMIEMGALPEGVQALSSKVEDGVLHLDMNQAYGDAVRSGGTVGETMMIYTLVNTFIQARSVDKALITIEGNVLETGHEVYDSPMEMQSIS